MQLLRAFIYLLSSGICFVFANNSSTGMTLGSYFVLAALALAGVGLGVAAIVEGSLAFNTLSVRQKRVIGYCLGLISLVVFLIPLVLLLVGIETLD